MSRSIFLTQFLGSRTKFSLIHYPRYVQSFAGVGLNTGLITAVVSLCFPVSALADPLTQPRVSIDYINKSFTGAFRVSHTDKKDYELTTAWGEGRIAYNSKRHSVFVDSHVYKDSIAEFKVPSKLSRSPNYKDLPKAEMLQDFAPVLTRTKTGNKQSIDTLGGMFYEQGKLFVHAYEYYDAPADNTHTTLVIEDADKLATSEVKGFYEMEGQAKTVSYSSALPSEWARYLNATHLAGNGGGLTINSRLSIGPSLYTFDTGEFAKSDRGFIKNKEWLSYKLDNALSTSLYEHNDQWGRWDAFNETGKRSNFKTSNDLWTDSSAAWFGFIVPNTRTYAVFGLSGMHKSGGGYKATQIDGNKCGGPCPLDPADSYSYYWLYDMADIVKGRAGKDAVPYEYGEFDNTFLDHGKGNTVGYPNAGAFDASTNRLMLSFKSVGDASGGGSPVIKVYDFKGGNQLPKPPKNLKVSDKKQR